MVVEATPEKLVEMASAFIERNPEAWSAMKAETRKAVDDCRHTSISRLAEDARFNMRLNGHDEGFRLNNSCRAVLARWLRDEIPGADKCIEIRQSKVDGRPK